MLDPRLEHGLVHAVPVEALAREGRDQRRVHVDHATREAPARAERARGSRAAATRSTAVARELRVQRVVEGLDVGMLASRDRERRDAAAPRALEAAGARLRRDHHRRPARRGGRTRCARAGSRGWCPRRRAGRRLAGAARAQSTGDRSAARAVDAVATRRETAPPEAAHAHPGVRLGRARPHHGLPGPLREPHPAGQGPRAERLLQHHQPEDPLRRRRGQHRLPPAQARRGAGDPGECRLRLRPLRRVARPQRHPPRPHPRLRRRAHAPGLRHHRPRRLPDLGLLRGRHGARPRGARRGREGRARARDRLLELAPGDGRARARAEAPRRAHLDRPEPRPADPRRARSSSA